MLPKKLPQIPNLEIAAYMKPATEVGGDYYDFHVGDDGTLTVAVGDATGHGLKAGTMVTATKSLFNNLASEPDIERIFKQSSAALKKMNLRGMFMAMTMAKIKDNQLTISCAGMPTVLIYRDEQKRVEEVSIKAMPWGSPLTTTFEQRETTLGAGDTIMMMSDGFPEMFNETGEMLDFGKAKRLLSVIAAESAQEIINRFVEVGENWAGKRPPDDDVTFVVLKVK
jgi:serine phosphatase RsbU (regulator of sigma subunit)